MSRTTLAETLLVGIVGVGALLPGPASGAPSTRATTSPADAVEAGEGLVVWESDRTDAWRIWWSPLERPSARPLSPDEPGRAHCCAHLAPDGKRLLWLSLPRGSENYPRNGAVGTLRLTDLARGVDRVVHPAVRTYFEHRAATWVDDRRVAVVLGAGPDAGRTVVLDAESGEVVETLTPPEPAPWGWLPDPTLRWATTGSPTFSRLDPVSGTVQEEPTLGGCQPWFTSDGRDGFWIAGAGGPIRRIDLESRTTSTVLHKSDPRLPADRGYLYFPMVSRDREWLAWAASDDDHPHDSADYDVFVVALDPATLEPVDTPIRITRHPGVDRFPDVRGPRLELGRRSGEEPFDLALDLPKGGPWQWTARSSVDGSSHNGTGERIELRLAAGDWNLEARRDGDALRGRARVRPGRPPQIKAVRAGPPDRIEVVWDEAVVAVPTAVLQPGPSVTGSSLSVSRRRLELALAAPLEGPARLRIGEVRDAAGHVAQSHTVEVGPPDGPVRPEDLVLRWAGPAAENRWRGREATVQRSVFTSHGPTWSDGSDGVVLAGGHWTASGETVALVHERLRRRNELTLALRIERGEPVGGTLVELGSGRGSTNFRLLVRGGRLKFRLRVPDSGRDASGAEVDLGPVPDGALDLVLAYTPGQLRIARSDRQARVADSIRGGFFHWTPLPLALGAGFEGGDAWRGRLGDVAIWDRALDAEDVERELARRRAERRRARTDVRHVDATLVAASDVPSLADIRPYREALAVLEYRTASGEVLRVAHRVLWDGEPLPIATRGVGTPVELELVPFAARPDLESLVLSDTLPERWDLDLWWSEDTGG